MTRKCDQKSCLAYGHDKLHARTLRPRLVVTQIATNLTGQALGYAEVELRGLAFLIGILEPLEKFSLAIFRDGGTTRILHIEDQQIGRIATTTAKDNLTLRSKLAGNSQQFVHDEFDDVIIGLNEDCITELATER